MQLIRLLRIASCRQIVLPALKVALIVGTLLNLVNQGGSLVSGTPINLTQMLLNFVVPFCVSSYSAARNEMRRTENEPYPDHTVRESPYRSTNVCHRGARLNQSKE